MAHARRVVVLLLPGVLAAGLVAGCGKKGPPLAPIVPTPARITDIVPRRLGDAVQVKVAVPDANLDGTRPVDLDRIEVYAFTGSTQTDVRDVVKYATRVGTIPVQRVYTAEDQEKWNARGVPPPPNPGAAPGAAAAVTEMLTAEMLTPVVTTEPKPKDTTPPPPVIDLGPRPLVGPVPEVKLRRYYAAVGFSRKKVKGPNSARPFIVLEAPPTAPREGTVVYAESGAVLAWKPPAEQREPIQLPADGDVLKSTPKGIPVSPVFTYNVYLVEPNPGGTTPAPGDTAVQPVIRPLNDKPLSDLTFTDASAQLGTERCYAIRAVDGVLESVLSAPLCVTPVDTFAPPAPASLAAIGSEGAVSLIWEGVEAADLAGYVVMRAEGATGSLVPLFAEPIKETAYRDGTAKPGVRYTYAVVAVDGASPRNVSLPSNRVEEAAR